MHIEIVDSNDGYDRGRCIGRTNKRTLTLQIINVDGKLTSQCRTQVVHLDAAAAAELADYHFQIVDWSADHHQHNQIRYEERSAAVLQSGKRKTPNVAQSDRHGDAGHQKLDVAAPIVALRCSRRLRCVGRFRFRLGLRLRAILDARKCENMLSVSCKSYLSARETYFIQNGCSWMNVAFGRRIVADECWIVVSHVDGYLYDTDNRMSE